MKSTGASIDISNLDAMITMFATAPKELDKAIKRAATKAGRIVKKAARAKAPNRKSAIKLGNKTYRYYGMSGALKRSIEANITKPGGRNMTTNSYRWAMAWSAYIGASTRYRQQVFVRWYRPRKEKPAKRNFMMAAAPVWYSHLVEKGFVAKIFGTAKRRVVPARPFLRPALDSNKQQVEALTLQELDAQWRKMAQAGKRARK